MSRLFHHIYASAAKQDLSAEGLAAIVETARRNNERRGITGVLLYVDGSFFQVLEGEQEAVEAMCRIISLDPRHTRFTQIISEPIAKRTFADWSMGFSKLSSDELFDVLDATEVDSWRPTLLAMDPSRAHKLLLAFTQGRWRLGEPGGAAVATV